MRRVLAAIVLLLLTTLSAHAQGCGTGNPGCTAPTAPTTPTCDNSSKIANTAFVAACGGTGGGGGGGGVPNITRAQIQSTNLTGVTSFLLSGYAAAGDDGSGSPMTCNALALRGANSIGAIQDMVGNWCGFDLPRVNSGLGFQPGWFGGDHTGGPDSAPISDAAGTAGVPAFQRAIDAAFKSGPGKVYCSGQYLATLPLFFDPPGNLRGAPTWFGQGLQPAGGWAPGSIVTIPNGATPYVNSSSLHAWGSPLSPDATGMAMDLAYRVVNSNASVTYAPTWTTAFPNGIIIAAFKGSGTIGTPVNIGTAYPETAMGTGFTTTATAPIGSAIFVAVNDISGTGVTSVTDSAGHTYTRVPSFIDNATIGGIFIYYSLNIGVRCLPAAPSRSTDPAAMPPWRHR